MPETITKEEVHAALEITLAVGEAIRDLKQVPSGHLYAASMAKLTIDQYNQIIATLKKARLVSETDHLLTWIGPVA